MTAVWTASGTNAGAVDTGFSASAFNLSSTATLGTGDIYLFIYQEGSGVNIPSLITIGGAPATQVGSSILVGTTFVASVWTVPSVLATGSIVITPNATFGGCMGNWGLATGEGTPVLTSFSNTGAANDQGPVPGTIPINGVGVFSIGAVFGNGTIPATWHGTSNSDNTHMEAGVATGNQIGGSGTSSITPGAASVTVTFQTFVNQAIIMLAFPATPGVGDTFGPSMRLVQMKRKSIGWTPLSDHRRRVLRPNRSLWTPQKLVLPKHIKKVA